MTTFLAAWRRLDEGRDRAAFYRMWRVGAAAGYTVPGALGEESGALVEALELLTGFHERSHRLTLAVRKRLAYPIVVVIAATFIAPIPLLFAGWVAGYVLAVIAGVAGWLLLGGGTVAAMARREEGKPALMRARLARALATAIEAGLPPARAVRLAADASGSQSIRLHVASVSGAWGRGKMRGDA